MCHFHFGPERFFFSTSFCVSHSCHIFSVLSLSTILLVLYIRLVIMRTEHIRVNRSMVITHHCNSTHTHTFAALPFCIFLYVSGWSVHCNHHWSESLDNRRIAKRNHCHREFIKLFLPIAWRFCIEDISLAFYSIKLIEFASKHNSRLWDWKTKCTHSAIDWSFQLNRQLHSFGLRYWKRQAFLAAIKTKRYKCRIQIKRGT